MVRALAIVAVLAGCKSKSDPPKPALPPGKVTGKMAATCSALIPAELRGGLDMDGTQISILGCLFYRAGNMVSGVAIDCAPGLTIDDFKTQRTSSADDVDIGRLGWHLKVVDRIEFFASKAACTVRVTSDVPGTIDTTAIARAVDAALTPATAPPSPAPPKGAAGLHCDRYIPQDIRTKAGVTGRSRQAYSDNRLECEYEGGHNLKVQLECGKDAAEADKRLASLHDMMQQLGGTNTPVAMAVGRNGFRYGEADAAFIDPETDCVITLTSYGVDATEVAKQIEAAVTPAAIAP